MPRQHKGTRLSSCSLLLPVAACVHALESCQVLAMVPPLPSTNLQTEYGFSLLAWIVTKTARPVTSAMLTCGRFQDLWAQVLQGSRKNEATSFSTKGVFIIQRRPGETMQNDQGKTSVRVASYSGQAVFDSTTHVPYRRWKPLNGANRLHLRLRASSSPRPSRTQPAAGTPLSGQPAKFDRFLGI
jgi:hypothetical protein